MRKDESKPPICCRGSTNNLSKVTQLECSGARSQTYIFCYKPRSLFILPLWWSCAMCNVKWVKWVRGEKVEQGRWGCKEDRHPDIRKVGSQGIDSGPSEFVMCVLHGPFGETCSRICNRHNIDARPPWHTVSTVYPHQKVQWWPPGPGTIWFHF